jgi:transposase-like protein
VWLDATFHKVRELGRVVSVATVVAVCVDSDGQRHVLGCDIGPSEDHVFWTVLEEPREARPQGREARDLGFARGQRPGNLAFP